MTPQRHLTLVTEARQDVDRAIDRLREAGEFDLALGLAFTLQHIGDTEERLCRVVHGSAHGVRA
jgi:hypothetical protein